ncbi:MAG: MFS transporter [Planctomycetaceae bacterium]
MSIPPATASRAATSSGPVSAADAGRSAAESLRITPVQWTSGAAAWLGWMFDGLDMHLYTLVAMPFVAELLAVDTKHPDVGRYGSWIQAAFLVGWALGGTAFGWLGDRLGRSRTLVLTILTYAAFTGLSYLAQTWWQLMALRFLAALGIGGEWAVGAALLAETWPARWRPWLAAVLQTGVNVGVMLAGLAVFLLAAWPPRTVFLVGILPALLVLWIRRAVPETEAWHAARASAAPSDMGIRRLFQADVLPTTLLTSAVCALVLTGHWAFMFWCSQHLRALPDIASWGDADKSRFVGQAMSLVMLASIVGNFVAAGLARRIGYRLTIVLMILCYFAAMMATYGVVRDHVATFWWLAAMGVSSGGLALFAMYLPPLFPTLLRTTGAGFCFNIGRIAAAAGTVLFGTFAGVADLRLALLSAGVVFLPAAGLAMLLPEARGDAGTAAATE